MANKKKLGRQTLAMLMAFVLSLSLVQMTAFAANGDGTAPAASEAPAVSDGQIQKDDSGNVLYYTSNSGGAFETTGDTEATVTNKTPDPNVTISKTIQGTSHYNSFDITLDVKTTQQVETVTTAQGAAVSLVLDTSRSMQWDASGGGYCLASLFDAGDAGYTADDETQDRVLTYIADADGADPSGHSGDYTFAGAAAQDLVKAYNENPENSVHYKLEDSPSQGDEMRISTIVESMTDDQTGFLDQYASSGSATVQRLVSLTAFNKDATTAQDWIDVSDADNLATLKNYLNERFTPAMVAVWGEGEVLSSGTNIEAGLQNGETLMQQKDNTEGIGPRYIILMTDGAPNTHTSPGKTDDKAAANDVAADIMNNKHYSLYAIGFATAGNSNSVSWLTPVTTSMDVNDANGIATQFNAIITTLTSLANAWKVTDPMGTYMGYVTGSAVVSSGTDSGSVSFDQGKIIWDLTKVIPQTSTTGEENDAVTTYHYALTYTVKLDAMHAPNEYQLTNGQTTLSYWLMDGEGNFLEANGTTVVDHVYQNPAAALLTLDFKVPKVKPALTSYTVTKEWAGTGDTDATRPENGISVQLYSGGEALGDSVQLTAASGWTYTWNNLPAELAGTFSVAEVTSLDNYTPSDPTYQPSETFNLTHITDKITPNNNMNWDLDSYIPNDEGTDGCDVAFVKLAKNPKSKIKFAIWTKDPVSFTIQQTLISKMKNINGFNNASFEKTVFFSGSEALTTGGGTTTVTKTSNATNVVFENTSAWNYFACGTYTYTPAGATITNTYTPCSITITKDVTGDLSESDVEANTFSFEIKGTDTANSSVDETVTLPTTDRNWSTTVSSLPFGAYTVTETSGSVKGYGWKVYKDSVADENNITADASGKYTQTVSLSPADSTANSAQAAVTAGTVTFVNDYSLGAPVNTAEFYVQKEDENGTSIPGGTPSTAATFTLYSDVDCTTSVTSGATDNRGMATITIPGTALTDDPATFYLKETDAPAGYQTNDTVWTVTVTKPADNAGSPSITIDTSGTLYHKVYHWLASLTGMNTDTSSWENNTLTVKDRAIIYSLKVTKTVSGAALPNDFEILVKDGDATVATLKTAAATGAGTAKNPYTWTVPDLTAATYDVVEVGSGAYVSDYNLTVKNADKTKITKGTDGNYTQSVKLTDEQPTSSVTFRNAYKHQTGTLKISKTFSGLTEAQIQNMASTFAIHYGEATYTLNDAATSPTAGGDWTTGVTYTWNVGKVDTGTYSAYETGYAAPAGYYCTTAVDPDTSDHHTVSTEVTSGRTGTIAFTNAYGMSGTGSFTVEKFGTDLEADLAPYALAGATFTLYTNSDCTTAITGSDRVTSGDPATVSYAGLTDGTYYLKESGAPTGYTADPTVYQVVVSVVQSQVFVEINVLSDDNEWVSCSNDYYNAEDNVLSVYNSRDYGILRITKDVTGSLSESNFSQAAFEFTVSNAMGVSVGTFDLPYTDQGELSWTKELNLPTGEYTVTENVLTPMSGYNRNTSISYGDSATYATVVKAAYEDDIPANPALVTVTNTYSTPYTPPTGTDYTLTVQWVDENGTALADSVTRTISSGSSYDADNISGGSGRTFDGYDYNGLDTGSDAISGTMNGNKTVIFVYTGTTIITTDETPLGETPEETETAEIPEGETPLAEAPKTGDELALWILAAAASGTGLIWLTISGKKRKDEGQDG